jgi:hypothetical protein
MMRRIIYLKNISVLRELALEIEQRARDQSKKQGRIMPDSRDVSSSDWNEFYSALINTEMVAEDEGFTKEEMKIRTNNILDDFLEWAYEVNNESPCHDFSDLYA